MSDNVDDVSLTECKIDVVAEHLARVGGDGASLSRVVRASHLEVSISHKSSIRWELISPSVPHSAAFHRLEWPCCKLGFSIAPIRWPACRTVRRRPWIGLSHLSSFPSSFCFSCLTPIITLDVVRQTQPCSLCGGSTMGPLYLRSCQLDLRPSAASARFIACELAL